MGATLSTIITYLNKEKKECVMVSDNKLYRNDKHKSDKIIQIYDRWLIGILGVNLIGEPLEDIAYFNDKSNRPKIENSTELIAHILNNCKKWLPHRLEHLEKNPPKHASFSELISDPCIYLVMDSIDLTLNKIAFKNINELLAGNCIENRTSWEKETVYYFGTTKKGNEPEDSENVSGKLSIFEYCKDQLEIIANLHPDSVRNDGVSFHSIGVDRYFFSHFSSFEGKIINCLQ